MGALAKVSTGANVRPLGPPIPAPRSLKRKRNSSSGAASMYESFHGMPSEETLAFTERIHAHDHLAGLGVLVGLKIRTVSGYDVTLGFLDGKKQNPSVSHYLSGWAAGARTSGMIPYRKTSTEVAAYKIQAQLERKGVSSRVDRVGRFGKYKYEVLVDRHQMRDALAEYRRNPSKHILGDDPKWALEWEKKQREEEKKQEALRKQLKGKKPNAAKNGPFKKAEGLADSALAAIDTPARKIMSTTLGALDSGLAYAGRTATKIGKGIKRGVKKLTNPEFSKICLLSSNEAGTQLFINGGDQSLDLKALKIEGHEADKENVVVGECWLLAYRTAKDFKDGDIEEADYVHGLGDEKAHPRVSRGGDLWDDAKPPEKLFGTGDLPTVIYKRLDKRIELAGGIYHIEKPWFETSPGIED